ncbi:MAG: VTT domain-containing protein [Candidatus Thorarchaeota archaeon]
MSDKIFLGSISLLLVYWAVILIVPDFLGPLQLMYSWLVDITLLIGYPGAFIVSFIGNATILLPFPYVGVPFILGGLRDLVSDVFAFDPWIVGMIAGLGAALGEMISYLIGYGGGSLIDEDQKNGFRNFVLRYPKTTPIVLWFLAVTPIPDDVLLVPLGAAKYSWWKVFIPQLVGKTMFLATIAWSGRFGMDWIGLLLGGADVNNPFTKSVEVIGLLLVVIAIYVIVRTNWSSMLQSD